MHEVLCVEVTFVVVVAEVLVRAIGQIVQRSNLLSKQLHTVFAFITLAKLLLHSLSQRFDGNEYDQRLVLICLWRGIAWSSEILTNSFLEAEASIIDIVDALKFTRERLYVLQWFRSQNETVL